MKAEPRFPPLLSASAVSAPDTARAAAVRAAAAGRLGAGDVLWARNTAFAELAIVLEPEVTLERAQQMLPLVHVALGDALGLLAPPQLPITWRWPFAIEVNAAKAGEAFLDAAPCAPGAVPAWLVVGFSLRLLHDDRTHEPGETPDVTSLREEGAGDVERNALLEAFAGFFLTRLDTWTDRGFRPIHDEWLYRASGRESPITFPTPEGSLRGTLLGLDEAVGAIVKPIDGGPARVLALGHALARAGASP